MHERMRYLTRVRQSHSIDRLEKKLTLAKVFKLFGNLLIIRRRLSKYIYLCS